MKITTIIGFICLWGIYIVYGDSKGVPVYNVYRLKYSMEIDGNWEKPEWENIKSLKIEHYMGEMPKFHPYTEVKMMYDDENLYIIFRVKDRYVQCVIQKPQGAVYEEACVEFFFSPDESLQFDYFNIETNCIGTVLMGYNSLSTRKSISIEVEDIKKIEIAHSLPNIVDQEIIEPVTWTIEYRIPLCMLEKYVRITHPEQGVTWRANFYKIAEKGSNPHFRTWAFVNHKSPNFHLPQYFGILKFQ